jgi:hypothetical protein
MYSEYFFTICKNFVYYYIKKYWNDSNHHYKVFQNQLLTFHKLSDEGRQYLLKKFFKFIKKNYKLNEDEFKQLYKNFFIEYTTDIFQSGVSKKEFSTFKLKNPNFINKINLKIPTIEQFIITMFKDSVKFFYNNAKFIVKSRFVILNNINENIKITIYKFLPLNDILILQKKVLNDDYTVESEKTKDEKTEEKNSNNKDLEINDVDSLEYLTEKSSQDDSNDIKLKSIY